MAKKIASTAKNDKANTQKPESRSHTLTRGADVSDVRQFCRVMSALMSDALSGAVSPGPGNLACNAAGKILKATEMQLKYGSKDGAPLALTTPAA